MRHPSIAATMRRIQRWPLRKQHRHIAELVAAEQPHSIRRTELEAALADIVMRDLRAGNRGFNRKGAA